MDSPELDWISIEGFKSIASSGRVFLRPINLVIGANGAGKSNFIEVFSLLQKISQGHLQDYVRTAGGAQEILHFGTNTTEKLGLEMHLKQEHAYRLELAPTANDGLVVVSEVMTHEQRHPLVAQSTYIPPSIQAGQEASISHESGLQEMPSSITHLISRWQCYHVHDTSKTSPLRRTNKTDDNDFLRPDGSNLAAFLYRLRETEHYVSYQMIRQTVQRIAPFFDDFLLRPDNLNPETIKLAWKHQGSDKYFGASSLSDGTLRFIALATLLLQPVQLRPSVILIDEPELGLHPAAIGLLASLIHRASEHTQVIAATQSPILLDHFEPEDVLVADSQEGATTFKRLEPIELAHWLEDYSLGQLWEKNYFGARPRPSVT